MDYLVERSNHGMTQVREYNLREISTSKNIFSSEKLRLFDVWKFPNNDFKRIQTLKHLINYYCRINEEKAPDSRSQSLQKRDWSQFESARFDSLFRKSAFDFDLNDTKETRTPVDPKIDTKGGRRFAETNRQKRSINPKPCTSLASATKKSREKSSKG